MPAITQVTVTRMSVLIVMLCLHLQRLRDNGVVVASDSDMKQYLPWPPWATRHTQDCFYLCRYDQGGQGKYYFMLLSLATMTPLSRNLCKCKHSITLNIDIRTLRICQKLCLQTVLINETDTRLINWISCNELLVF